LYGKVPARTQLILQNSGIASPKRFAFRGHQPLMNLRADQNWAGQTKAWGGDRKTSSVLLAISAELAAGATYVTMAAIAFDLGQTERGSSLLNHAAAAHNHGKRLAEQLTGACRQTIEDQLADLGDTIENSSRGDSVFAPSIRQPSLS
jgi:hypothetical protein